MEIQKVVDIKVKGTYGYCPNISLSIKRNTFNVLMSCPLDLVNSRPTNLAFHNLCKTTILPKTLRSLLGLGTNFSIKPAIPTLTTVDFKRFQRDYDRRIMFSNAPVKEMTTLYAKNEEWQPEHPDNPEIVKRRLNFELQVRQLFA